MKNLLDQRFFRLFSESSHWRLKIKNVFGVTLILLFVLGLSSCSKDGDDEKDEIEIVTMYISNETKFMKFIGEELVECMIVTVQKEQSYIP